MRATKPVRSQQPDQPNGSAFQTDRRSNRTNFKTLTLAAVAALSLGFGTAMAQESAGGVGFGPWETEQLQKALSGMHRAAPFSYPPGAGSSDVYHSQTPVQHPLIGGDGNG
jgi:hypothetical protein